ncbi:hypothetical protein [Thalassotalea montiporae]
MSKITITLMLTLLTLGCSNKQLYELGQGYQKSECINNAQSGDEYQACHQAKKPYQEYKKERKSIIDKKA